VPGSFKPAAVAQGAMPRLPEMCLGDAAGMRVAVTGIGCISAAGPDLASALAACDTGGVAPARPQAFTTDHPTPSPVFATPWIQDHPDLLRASSLALAASAQALADAGLDDGRLAGLRVGVCLGTTGGCAIDDAQFYRDFRAGREPILDAVRRLVDRDCAAMVARAHGLHGPTMCVLDACCSGTDAIGLAAEWIRQGQADVVLAGGADPLSLLTYDGFSSLLVTGTGRCRPFSRGRDGLNLGEGGGILILESAERALARGARIQVEILGFGLGSDAYHPTAPHPGGRGLRKALAAAMAEAGVGPESIACVNAHGTGTIDNDTIESGVLADVLPGVPFVSTKGSTGHCLGAAGAIEAAFTIGVLARGHLHPSQGLTEPDPALRASASGTARPLSGRVAISESLAFGGANSALVLGLPNAGRPTVRAAPGAMRVLGMGAVGGFGAGMPALIAALGQGAVVPSSLSTGPEGRTVPGYRADTGSLATYLSPKALRRTDHFTQLALLAAAEALAEAGIHGEARGAVGVVVATGFGPTSSTTAFLDSIMENGDAFASPTRFVHATQNAAAADIGVHLGCAGPTVTVTRFGLSVPAALMVAQGLLDARRCDLVLVVGVDEYTPLIGHCYRRMWERSAAIAPRPLAFPEQTACPGEGAAALVLCRGAGVGAIETVGMGALAAVPRATGTWVLDADGHRGTGRRYAAMLPAGARAVAWADRWGSFPTQFGFTVLASVLAARRGALFSTDQNDASAVQEPLLAVAVDTAGDAGWCRIGA
jgi:3-oxoacyl-[acyl-carrier-protein] synthase II